MTPSVMTPMTGYPDISTMRWFGPMTARVHISAIANFPFFTDPHMSWTGTFGTYDHRCDRSYMYIDLCGSRRSRKGAEGNDKGQKSPLDQILFHLFDF
jgi:hypothetical protein